MFANARMYCVNPPATAAWRTLLQWVIDRAGVACEVLDYPAPQPLPALWSRPDMGCAFMCGYPYALANPRPVLLAAPLPLAPDGTGAQPMPMYCTDIVVRADSPYREPHDLFGRRFAYTATDSQSGCQAPRAFFAPYASGRGKLFSEVVGPLVTPRRVIETVLANETDAGPLDSYVHALLRAHEPEVAARLRTVASTQLTAMPPLVAAPGGASETAARLRDALLSASRAPELAPTLASLRLAGFAAVAPDLYDDLVDRARAADALGYPELA